MARGRQFGRNLGHKLVVRKDFNFNGRKLKGGDEFEYKRFGADKRKVNQLLNSGHIAFKGDRLRDPSHPAGEPSARHPLSVNEMTAEEYAAIKRQDPRFKTAEELRDKTFSPLEWFKKVLRGGKPGPAIVLTGIGYYDVVNAEGKRVNTKKLRKADAEALLQTL